MCFRTSGRVRGVLEERPRAGQQALGSPDLPRPSLALSPPPVDRPSQWPGWCRPSWRRARRRTTPAVNSRGGRRRRAGAALVHAELMDVTERIVDRPTAQGRVRVSSYENDPLRREGISAMTQTATGSPHVGTSAVEVGASLAGGWSLPARSLPTTLAGWSPSLGRRGARRCRAAGPWSRSGSAAPRSRTARRRSCEARTERSSRSWRPDLRRVRARLETGAAEP